MHACLVNPASLQWHPIGIGYNFDKKTNKRSPCLATYHTNTKIGQQKKCVVLDRCILSYKKAFSDIGSNSTGGTYLQLLLPYFYESRSVCLSVCPYSCLVIMIIAVELQRAKKQQSQAGNDPAAAAFQGGNSDLVDLRRRSSWPWSQSSSSS